MLFSANIATYPRRCRGLWSWLVSRQEIEAPLDPLDAGAQVGEKGGVDFLGLHVREHNETQAPQLLSVGLQSLRSAATSARRARRCSSMRFAELSGMAPL